MVDAGEIYHPLRWTPAEALQLLQDVAALESAGVVVRVPATWRGNRPPRPQVTATVGGKPPSRLGTDALLDFQMEVTLDGERLTEAEIKQLLAADRRPRLVRGHWVEVDRERLSAMLEQFRPSSRRAAAERPHLRRGDAHCRRRGRRRPRKRPAEPIPTGRTWSRVRGWRRRSAACAARDGLAHVDPGRALQATLRPYQQVGRALAPSASELGLGACLADDMGLGKTIQVLSLLLVLRSSAEAIRASRAPGRAGVAARQLGGGDRALRAALTAIVAHPSAMPGRRR